MFPRCPIPDTPNFDYTKIMALWRVAALSICIPVIVIVGYKLFQSSPTLSTITSPSATPFTTPVPSPGTLFPISDGYVGREASPPEPWKLIGNNPATVNLTAESSGSAPYLRQQAPERHYDILRRAIFHFDTSALPEHESIDSAHLEVYVNSLNDTLGDQAVIAISDDSKAAGVLALSDPILMKNILSKSVLTLPLNAQGLAQIRQREKIQIALVLDSDRADSEPAWLGPLQETYLNLDFVEGPHPPRLVTSHASSP